MLLQGVLLSGAALRAGAAQVSGPKRLIGLSVDGGLQVELAEFGLQDVRGILGESPASGDDQLLLGSDLFGLAQELIDTVGKAGDGADRVIRGRATRASDDDDALVAGLELARHCDERR